MKLNDFICKETHIDTGSFNIKCQGIQEGETEGRSTMGKETIRENLEIDYKWDGADLKYNAAT